MHQEVNLVGAGRAHGKLDAVMAGVGDVLLGHPAAAAAASIPGPVLDNCLTMNQQCKVCGEPAAGFHFGAFTCEGCKSFFGRTYNNLGSISECKNAGTCVINKKNRTSCKACRLRKCLMVGMSKSGSRYGRRSNWFKIHCLLQQQSQQSAQQGTPGSGNTPVYPGAFLHNPFLTSPSSALADYNRESESKGGRSPSSSSEYSDADHESSRSPGSASYLWAPAAAAAAAAAHQIAAAAAAHQIPSPLSEPDGPPLYPSPPFSGPPLFHPVSPATRGVLSLPPPPPAPALPLHRQSTSLMFLDPGCPPRTGGDLALASPALAGVAEEQDQPMDLSVKGCAAAASSAAATPPSSPPVRGTDGTTLTDTEAAEVRVQTPPPVSTPLDLTSRRSSEET